MATKTILILAANPSDTGRLRLMQEVRDIKEGLALSTRHHNFEVVEKWAVRPKDLQRAVLEYEPEFVHFSGHGKGIQGILLENELGEAQAVSGEALSGLFSLCPSVKCVLLNACYSKVQAEAIGENVDYVVGMNNAIGDQAALKFAVGFYDALGFNRTVPDAYRFGRVSIEMEGIVESDIPILKIRPNIDNEAEPPGENDEPAAENPTLNIEPAPLEEPEGKVGLGSPFYIKRSSIETDCYEAVIKPGALIRIKAPREMGKSSLMTRTLAYAESKGCRVVRLNFRAADREILGDLDELLQWFCYSVTDELDLPDQLDTWAKSRLGLLRRCQRYFERYVLAKISDTLVLGLDEVDQICKYPDVAIDFFSMLRVWHEASKDTQKWRKFHMVIAHTQDIDIPLEAKRSPFNVGTAIKLQEFNDDELSQVVALHGVQLSSTQLQNLKTLLGGHPYLWRKALYRLAKDRITLPQFQEEAATDNGPYGTHLQQFLTDLQAVPQLAETFWDILQTDGVFAINTAELSKETTQLNSLGLIRYEGDGVIPFCDLYRQYFQARLM